ncbi:uncharacterized protein BDZ99DRAFT_381773 [Mytilinidion resinicola]|uniref:Uncharacterized protein n=1 Tax=Mytilinidion resinicola TaxID=574789 RepID=A0A6A6YYR8_9PEZI|nr:uncharacterized protein BDZ99DRAFT_381773 [Mytilinidion resinicola]KAF2813075.1 hypothetical protein BDZ99DRAFT_381773 [Mytilinidion resinicola]
MIAVNLVARGKVKRHCLTFGDVIVASASDPELRVKDECMVNAAENYRRQTDHTCHKHCTAEPSTTGDEIGHCQKCKKFNVVNKFVPLAQPTIATKIKKSLISNLGNTALTQMALLFICSLAMLMGSIVVAQISGSDYKYEKDNCKTKYNRAYYSYCNQSDTSMFAHVSGGWGGFNSSLEAASLAPDKLSSELLSFCISNGAQFIYSLLYLMLIYNITLICQERDWGNLETRRRHLRCTIVIGEAFREDYLLQLPKYVLFPIMGYSVLTHWMIGEALQTQESVWRDTNGDHPIEHSKYVIVYAAYPLWGATVLVLVMTGLCWWAFTYRREGFIPQMFGSLRACCAATSELDDFTPEGIQWGDLGAGEKFRHAGLSAEPVGKIHPNELYAGRGGQSEEAPGGARRRAHND